MALAAARLQVTRDRIMEAYHKLHPEYGFDKHKARMPCMPLTPCLHNGLECAGRHWVG